MDKIRNSKKREQILNVFNDNHLLTAIDVCEMLPNLDPATIYRNLNFYVEKGLLREVKIKKGITSYELNDDSHQHLVCEKCDSITSIEIDTNELTKLISKSQFTPNKIELNIKGSCKDCN